MRDYSSSVATRFRSIEVGSPAPSVNYRNSAGLVYTLVDSFDGPGEHFQIYEVSLGKTHQGYRAKGDYSALDRSKGSFCAVPIEVVLNGPGVAKARQKMNRAIMFAKEDRSKYGEILLSGKRHPNAKPKKRKKDKMFRPSFPDSSRSWRW